MGVHGDLTYHVFMQMPHGGAVSLVKSPTITIKSPSIATSDLITKNFIFSNAQRWGKDSVGQIPLSEPEGGSILMCITDFVAIDPLAVLICALGLLPPPGSRLALSNIFYCLLRGRIKDKTVTVFSIKCQVCCIANTVQWLANTVQLF